MGALRTLERSVATARDEVLAVRREDDRARRRALLVCTFAALRKRRARQRCIARAHYRVGRTHRVRARKVAACGPHVDRAVLACCCSNTACQLPTSDRREKEREKPSRRTRRDRLAVRTPAARRHLCLAASLLALDDDDALALAAVVLVPDAERRVGAAGQEEGRVLGVPGEGGDGCDVAAAVGERGRGEWESAGGEVEDEGGEGDALGVAQVADVHVALVKLAAAHVHVSSALLLRRTRRSEEGQGAHLEAVAVVELDLRRARRRQERVPRGRELHVEDLRSSTCHQYSPSASSREGRQSGARGTQGSGAPGVPPWPRTS